MNKITGYLVQYSTGTYEDYTEHNVAVYTNKEEAERAVKRVNKEHTNPEEGVISDEDWENILYEYDEWFEKENYINSEVQKKYPNLLGKERYDYTEWRKDHERTIEEQKMLQEDIVMKHYPNLSIEEVRKEIEIRDKINMLEYLEYGKAWIDEINIYID